MNELMQNHLSQKHAENLALLTDEVKKLRIDEIGKVVGIVNYSLEKNTQAVKSINLDSISLAVSTALENYQPFFKEQNVLLGKSNALAGNIKQAVYGSIAILSVIALEILWVCLKR